RAVGEVAAGVDPLVVEVIGKREVGDLLRLRRRLGPAAGAAAVVAVAPDAAEADRRVVDIERRRRRRETRGVVAQPPDRLAAGILGRDIAALQDLLPVLPDGDAAVAAVALVEP